MKQKPFTLLFGLACVVAIVWGGAFFLADDQKLSFADPHFEQAIRMELQLEDEPIRKDMLSHIESLTLDYAQIESIEGIEHFESLTSLDLTGNKISDLAPLEQLTGLTSLTITDNKVESLEPIAGLQGLTSLNVRQNQLSSLEPIRGLTRLEYLNIRENRIQDLEPIREMEFLRDLNARYNNIDSVDTLRRLPMLRDRLYLEGNPIEDLMALSSIYDDILDKDFPRPELELVFSEEGGLYDGALSIAIETVGEAEGEIRFTLDGSEVDESSSAYSGPIAISENTVVRAKFFAETGEESLEAAHTYLIGESSTLPIVSIATAHGNLFDEEYGIYVPGVYHNPEAENPNLSGNFMQTGQFWERPIYLEMFEPTGERVLAQGAGIRIHGGASRSYPRKSFRLYARAEFGENRFRHAIFGDEERDVFNRLLLRNSGNDWNNTLFRDAMLQELIRDFDVETQLYQPASLYINGDYWGIYNFRERYDRHYFELAHDVKGDALDLLDGNATVVEGSNHDYLELLDYMKENGVTDQEHYQYVSEWIDLSNFIDYNIAQIYVRNTDWPGNNNVFWRERPNGKWRWAVFDMDFGFDLPLAPGTVAHDTLQMATEAGGDSWPNPDWSTFLLRTLLTNEAFKDEFVIRFAHAINTAFAPSHVNETIEEMAAVLAPEMDKHIERWGAPESFEKWEEEISVMRRFAGARPHYVRAHLLNHFGLSGTATMTIEEIGEEDWSIAGVDASSLEEGWSGTYVTDTPMAFAFAGHADVNVETSDASVAEIDEQGRVTLRNEGEATVHFTAENGQKLLTLTFAVEQIDQEAATLEVGELTTVRAPEVIRWQTSDANVVAVSDEGTVEGIAPGTATLTGHNGDGDVVAIRSIEVIAIARGEGAVRADDQAVSYSLSWFESNVDRHSDSQAFFSNDEGASVTLHFEGTGIRWYGYSAETQGIAYVYLDGELVDTVDTYSREVQFQELLFEQTNLEDGLHTITIEVTGEANTYASANRIHVDRFEIITEE